MVAVHHLVRPEGHVADGGVEEVVLKVRPLVAVDGYVCVLVKLAGYAPRQAVQLHAVELCLAHALGHDAEEIARPTGRLKDIALGEAHPL